MNPYKFVTEDSRGNTREYPVNISEAQAKGILADIAFGGHKLHVWVLARTYTEDQS